MANLELSQVEIEHLIDCSKLRQREILDSLGQVTDPPGGIISYKEVKHTMDSLRLQGKVHDKLIGAHLEEIMVDRSGGSC